MKLKGIELKGTYKVKFEDTWLVVFDDKGNKIYIEFSDGGWKKREFNEKGKEIYYETDGGYWIEKEYDDKGNIIYLETSTGYIIDDRAKGLTGQEYARLTINEDTHVVWHLNDNVYDENDLIDIHTMYLIQTSIVERIELIDNTVHVFMKED